LNSTVQLPGADVLLTLLENCGRAEIEEAQKGKQINKHSSVIELLPQQKIRHPKQVI
jgi:hypothetical protein